MKVSGRYMMEEERQIFAEEDVQSPVPEELQEAEFINHEDTRFRMTIEIRNTSMHMVMEGKLDTAGSDGMMKRFNEEVGKRTFGEIIIDMEKLEYLSSSGLRVLLLIRRHLTGGGSFHVTNVNSVIREIMENTGFDEILL